MAMYTMPPMPHRVPSSFSIGWDNPTGQVPRLHFSTRGVGGCRKANVGQEVLLQNIWHKFPLQLRGDPSLVARSISFLKFSALLEGKVPLLKSLMSSSSSQRCLHSFLIFSQISFLLRIRSCSFLCVWFHQHLNFLSTPFSLGNQLPSWSASEIATEIINGSHWWMIYADLSITSNMCSLLRDFSKAVKSEFKNITRPKC